MNDDQQNVTQEEGVGFVAPEGHTGMKIVVILLGLGIVAMLVLIIGKILSGDHEKVSDDVPSAQSTADLGIDPSRGQISKAGTKVAEGGLAELFGGGDITIEKPQGASLREVKETGSQLLLVFDLPDGSVSIAAVVLWGEGAVRWVHIPAS